MKKFLGDYDKTLFWSTIAIMGGLLLFGSTNHELFARFWTTAKISVINNFSWFNTLLLLFIVGFLLILTASKYGSVRIGPDGSKPEHSTFTWLSMLFSSGVGIGLIFWGAAGPISHFMNPPYLSDLGGEVTNVADRLRVALSISTMHWGLNGWALFSAVGLAMGLVAYRLDRPLTIANAMYGLFGKKVNGPFGKVIDLISIIATIAGISTSLGMGVMSISYAANILFGIENSMGLNVIILIVMIIIFVLSSAFGISKGMSRISLFSVFGALFTMIFLLAFGPTRFILNSLVLNIGGVIDNFVYISTWTDPMGDGSWMSAWSGLYWAWWLSWTPFVGGFVAKISKGRTIREFLGGVMFVPTIFTIIWMSILGTAGIDVQINRGVDLMAAVAADSSSGIYTILSTYPFAGLMSFILMITMVAFVVTSADASSFYCSAVITRGSSDPAPSVRIILGTIIGVIAIFLTATGGLSALQSMAILGGLPFAFVTLLILISLYKLLYQNKLGLTEKSFETSLAGPEKEKTVTAGEIIANAAKPRQGYAPEPVLSRYLVTEEKSNM